MKKSLNLIIFILISINCCLSQNDSITFYKGNIILPNDSLEIILSLEKSSLNKLKIFVPSQLVYAYESDEYVNLNNDSIDAYFPKLQSRISLCLNKDENAYLGKWAQGAGLFDVVMKQEAKENFKFLERPQEPKPPFPYIEKEYIISDKDQKVQLSGTLTIPDTINKYPLVILVTGSGQQDRNEEIAGHKPFLIIADYLSRNGIAVFRYDDRGFGKSKGDFIKATTNDFMNDAMLVVDYFKNMPEFTKVGIAGHSEGGTIAIMAAAKYPKQIDFIVNLAGMTKDGKSLLLQQQKDILLADGLGRDTLNIFLGYQEKLLNSAIKSKDIYSFRADATKYIKETAALLPEELAAKYKITESNVSYVVYAYSTEWMKYFIQLNPKPYLKKLKCPILSIYGDKDLQVHSKLNIAEIDKYVKNKKLVFTYELKNKNHLFQHSETGKISEYFMLNDSFPQEALVIIKDFIKNNID